MVAELRYCLLYQFGNNVCYSGQPHSVTFFLRFIVAVSSVISLKGARAEPKAL